MGKGGADFRLKVQVLSFQEASGLSVLTCRLVAGTQKEPSTVTLLANAGLERAVFALGIFVSCQVLR